MPRAVTRSLKTLLGSFLLLVVLASATEATVEQWGVFDISFSGTTNGNPFIDAQLSANFSRVTSEVEAADFYDGDGIYRVRFTPDKPGSWHCTTHSNRPELDDKAGEFTIIMPVEGEFVMKKTDFI